MTRWETALAIRMGAIQSQTSRSEPRPLVQVVDTVATPDLIISASDPRTVANAVQQNVAANGQPPHTICVDKVGHFALSAGKPGRLAGCVAVVTGSAQGFGRGIAEELLQEGAAVVITDINDHVGQQTTQELAETYDAERVLYCNMNVTSLAAVEEALQTTVARFGGLDLFVANAGVLKAGGLDEMDEASFGLVTKVNYEAYFLGTKAAAAIMRRQHELCPDYFMDIIQINSKSGLEGSKRNFAYAGSKFGTLGLTQSFALELVEDNIKVNSICPGNYFDGPLWSDPERGLFVQYLNTGKVPGAKTLEDVKRFYMAKIPMNRGCTPRDVAQAIFYCHDQQYETGQAIPVTGGQVMLK